MGRRRSRDSDENGGPDETYNPQPSTGKYDPVAWGRYTESVKQLKRETILLFDKCEELEEEMSALADKVSDGHTEVMGAINTLAQAQAVASTRRGTTWKTLSIVAGIVIGAAAFIGTLFSIASSVSAMRAEIRNGRHDTPVERRVPTPVEQPTP